MSPSETPTQRVGADGETVETPSEPTGGAVRAEIPGADPSKFVEVTLAHPLNKADRIYLGLPEDASTEVGQTVQVSKNGAKAIINAGYAQVDPEDADAVRRTLRGEDAQQGEPTSEPVAEAPDNPALNPPQARSTPGSDAAPSAPASTEGGGARAKSTDAGK